MKRIEVTAQIKEQIHMHDIFEKYGFKVKQGAVVCPFHTEKTPSLRAYKDDTQWHCFGCGAGGDVISFVMKYFNLNFTAAVQRIDQDFGLNITDVKPSLRNNLQYSRVIQKKKQRTKELEKLNNQYRVLSWEYQSCRELISLTAPQSPDEGLNDIYVTAVKRLEFLEYRLDDLLKEMR